MIWVHRFINDSPSRKSFEAVGQDVGGDRLWAIQEVLVLMLVKKEQISDDEQSPLVSKHVQYVADYAIGSGVADSFTRHITILSGYLQNASNMR